MTEIEIQGQLERITYHNDENHYTVAKVRVKGQRDLITIVGSIVSVSPGEVLRLKGTWDRHPRYGEQFRIISYESIMPATAKGIERYLGSGLIKGIGPVMAARLVKKFGTETLDIIESNIGRLLEVEGIGEKRVDMIGRAWADQKEIRNVMLFLQGHEVSSSYAARIYRQYGSDSIAVVRENPYRLAEDIFGFGFITADRIAEKLGVRRDSPLRASAGILHVLHKCSDEGHVFYPYDALLSEGEKILGIEREIIAGAINKLVLNKNLVIEDKAVYLAGFHAAELGVAANLKAIAEAPGRLLRLNAEELLGRVQEGLGIELAAKQSTAVKKALGNNILVVTGGPGTGKTTIIRAIVRIYQILGLQAMLAAPTGRAARRMSEAAGFSARTIHRLLEYSPQSGGFRRNDTSRLETDLLVIDEASMIDTVLMHHLLKAVRPGSTLILVGDVDQLPSVGPGNVLKDIIDSGVIPTIRLNEIFRQSGESLIVVNAHRINSGEFPLLPPQADGDQDFYFFEAEEPEKAADIIVDLCKNRIPAKFGFHGVDDIQVLTPMHRGIVGASNLNEELQKHLNPSTDELAKGGKTFRPGDKVMQIRNNYDKDVYNGDIGRIASIDREDRELVVDFDGKAVTYDFTDLDEVVPAYAVSVHKAQGSEYPAVVMPLLTQHYMMLQRNLLYTAVTRGKELVVIVGTRKALAIALKNDKPRMRYTRLRELLVKEVDGRTPLRERPDILP